MIREVARGTWLYAGTVPTLVRVVETDCDHWFAVGQADGQLEAGERPELNDQGLVYYVHYTSGWEPGEPFWPESQGFMTIADAKASAEKRIAAGPVSWF